MEKYDTDLEARVWERLRGGSAAASAPPQDVQTLLAMINERWTDALTYHQLSKRLSGNAGATLKKLSAEEQANVACLRGIYTLITGQKASLSPPPVSREPADRILRRCYGREIRCLAGFEARTAHPEYGAVFARLAEQKREHCMLLLQLIGTMEQSEKGK